MISWKNARAQSEIVGTSCILHELCLRRPDDFRSISLRYTHGFDSERRRKPEEENSYDDRANKCSNFIIMLIIFIIFRFVSFLHRNIKTKQNKVVRMFGFENSVYFKIQKGYPYIIDSADFIFHFGPLRSARIF